MKTKNIIIGVIFVAVVVLLVVYSQQAGLFKGAFVGLTKYSQGKLMQPIPGEGRVMLAVDKQGIAYTPTGEIIIKVAIANTASRIESGTLTVRAGSTVYISSAAQIGANQSKGFSIILTPRDLDAIKIEGKDLEVTWAKEDGGESVITLKKEIILKK